MSEQKWYVRGPLTEEECGRAGGVGADIVRVIEHDDGVVTTETICDDMDEDVAAMIVACVQACAGIPDPAAEIARLREVEAELTKLRTVYAAAVEECRVARREMGYRDNEGVWRIRTAWEPDPKNTEANDHDAARAEAGMEEIK